MLGVIVFCLRDSLKEQELMKSYGHLLSIFWNESSGSGATNKTEDDVIPVEIPGEPEDPMVLIRSLSSPVLEDPPILLSNAASSDIAIPAEGKPAGEKCGLTHNHWYVSDSTYLYVWQADGISGKEEGTKLKPLDWSIATVGNQLHAGVDDHDLYRSGDTPLDPTISFSN